MLPLFNFLLAYYSESSFDSRISSLPAPDRLIRSLIPWRNLEQVNKIFPPLLEIDLTEQSTFKSGIDPVGSITSVNLFLKLLTNSIAGYAKKELLNKPDAILAELPPTIVPDDDTFFMMVKYWKYVLPTSAQSPTERDELLAAKAQKLFEMMIQGYTISTSATTPTSTTSHNNYKRSLSVCSSAVLSTLLELWTKVDPYRAVDTIELMMKLGITPTAQDFSIVIKSLIDINRLNECELLLNLHLSAVADLRSPDPTCCDLVLEAFATQKAPRSLRDDPGERATKLVSKIVTAGGKVSSNMAMQTMMAWSRSRSPLSARKAEQFLRSSLASGMPPLHQHFNKLLDIYGKVDLRNTTLKSEEILQWMRNLELEPNLVTYNSVLSAWGRSNDPLAEERAFAIFDKILEQGLQPDIITYTSLLSAISRSRDPNAPVRADDIFEQMLHDHISPDIVAYSILISVWSKSFHRNKEDRVLEIYER
jgi:hypothetical protein